MRRLNALLLCCAALVQAQDSAPSRTWLDEGPIYETHPFYYGGGIRDVTRTVPDIASLGVRTLYLMPVFEQPGGGPADLVQHSHDVYRISDPTVVDRRYGTADDLKELVAKAHKHGLKVLFDLVPDNAPKDGVVYKNGWTHRIPLADLEALAAKADRTLEHEHREGGEYVYAARDEKRGLFDVAGLIDGDQVRLMHFPRALWGFAPDYTNAGLIDYYAGVAEEYVKEFDIDGLRIDAPADNWNPRVVKGDHSIVPLLTRVRDAMRKRKPDAVLLSETAFIGREPNAPPVLDDVCGAAYSHRLEMDAFKRKTFGGDSRTLIDLIQGEPTRARALRARFLETHDSERIASAYPSEARAMFVLMATLPGIPMIQAGQEVGATVRYGAKGETDWKANADLRAFYTKVFAARSQSAALRQGDLRDVWSGGDRLIACQRSCPAGDAVVVVNLGSSAAKAVLSVKLAAGTSLLDALSGDRIEVKDPASLPVEVPSRSARVLLTER